MASAGGSRTFPVLITILLLLLLLLFPNIPCYSLAANTLRQGGPALNTSSTLVSPNGLFTLGFQMYGYGQSRGNYLLMWYTNVNTSSYWTANPNFPIPNYSGALILNRDGVLQLTYSDGIAVELYSNSQRRQRLIAVLEDTGNFVVRDDSGSGELLWQSFDSPTDSWLPGMKLGMVNRQNLSLTSWLTGSIPLFGAFTLEWDPAAGKEELVMKRRGEVYWTSGKQLGPDRFQNLDLRNSDSDINVSRISNLDEDYLTFTYQRKFTVLQMGYRGLLLYLWPDSISGAIGGDCDGKGTDNGCLRWQGPECRRNDGDSLQWLQGTLRSWVFHNTSSYGNLSTSDCMEMCWRDCECRGTSDSNSGTGCNFFKEGGFEKLSSGDTYYVIVSTTFGEANNTTTHAYPPTHSPAAARSRNIWIWIAVAVAVAAAGALCILCFRTRRKSRERVQAKLMASKPPSYEIENEGNEVHDGLMVHSVASIMTATDDFSLQNKLGQGGFGPVYKGKLSDGQEVAVKRLSQTSGQGLAEFMNELILIAKLQHRNLVRLLGYCVHGEEKMLVYEYMPNKSVDSFLFDESKKFLLGWNKRFNIIEGIAQGLLYLHKYSRVRIVHRDLKVGNILLDENMDPKISDFGMARIFDTSALAANTNRPVGTYGYMSPEYAMDGTFSTKSDVFSFGVMLLEIVSGRKNHSLIQLDRPVNLLAYAWKLWKEGTPLQLMDPSLEDSCNYEDQEQVRRCITVGLICMEYDPEDRPEISDVLSMLTSEVAQLPSPIQPACTVAKPRSVSTKRNSTTSHSEIYMSNEVTITTTSPR